jgi:hypothetical protein
MIHRPQGTRPDRPDRSDRRDSSATPGRPERLDRLEDERFEPGPLVERGRLIPPILSVALVVAVLVGLTGLGLGYRLGQQSAPTPAVSSMVTFALATTVPTPAPMVVDLQPASVSSRLQRAYQASAPGSWAICAVGASVTCHTLAPSEDRSVAIHQTIAFTSGDMAELPRALVSSGHLVLVAALGEGVVTGSLVILNQAGGQAGSEALQPLDPGAAGVDFFDLGNLGAATYAIVASFTSQADVATPSADQIRFLAFFVVAG